MSAVDGRQLAAG